MSGRKRKVTDEPHLDTFSNGCGEHNQHLQHKYPIKSITFINRAITRKKHLSSNNPYTDMEIIILSEVGKSKS